MKLIECLNQLPEDMMMIDLLEHIYTEKTVAQIKRKLTLTKMGMSFDTASSIMELLKRSRWES